MFEELKEVVRGISIDDVYLTGIVDVEEGIAEFVANRHFLYFEFGDKFVEFEAIDNYSKLRIAIVDCIRHEIEFEDVMPGVTKIGEIIFTNPLATNRIIGMYFYNLEDREIELECDVVHIKLLNGQDIFIDPAFLGINIGGLEQRHFWEENLMDRAVPKETYIEFKHL